MSATRLKQYLDGAGVTYTCIVHPAVFTANDAAASAHVVGRDFAKTVIVRIDGELAMVVLPASRRLLLPDLREMLGTDAVRLATEAEFRDAFPDCELGAMPPFGNLYGMRVYVAASLADEPDIAFNACSHTEVIKVAYADFQRLAQPAVLDFVTT
ncbi:MAG TPA: YbaK/EbsC family protein [Opitutaceae bacterium]|nr:YbaK/EbsC family protein [Opitutaceae bacterium]